MQRGKVLSRAPKKKQVWRITEAAPLGEFVDPKAAATAPAKVAAAPRPGHEGWTISSFDLKTGVEVTEEDPSTVPAELFDELFKEKKN